MTLAFLRPFRDDDLDHERGRQGGIHEITPLNGIHIRIHSNINYDVVIHLVEVLPALPFDWPAGLWLCI